MFPSEMEQITFINQQGSGEKPGPFAMPGEGQPTAGDAPGFIEDYNAVKEAHPRDIVLYQGGISSRCWGRTPVPPPPCWI